GPGELPQSHDPGEPAPAQVAVQLVGEGPDPVVVLLGDQPGRRLAGVELGQCGHLGNLRPQPYRNRNLTATSGGRRAGDSVFVVAVAAAAPTGVVRVGVVAAPAAASVVVVAVVVAAATTAAAAAVVVIAHPDPFADATVLE